MRFHLSTIDWEDVIIKLILFGILAIGAISLITHIIHLVKVNNILMNMLGY